MATQERHISVYENWSGEEPVCLGELYINYIRGQESFAFSYNPAWLLNRSVGMMLDPDLELYVWKYAAILEWSRTRRKKWRQIFAKP